MLIDVGRRLPLHSTPTGDVMRRRLGDYGGEVYEVRVYEGEVYEVEDWGIQKQEKQREHVAVSLEATT